MVILQLRLTERILGRDYPERESMPPTKTWGALGWTLCTLGEASRKFQEVRNLLRGSAASTVLPAGCQTAHEQEKHVAAIAVGQNSQDARLPTPSVKPQTSGDSTMTAQLDDASVHELAIHSTKHT